MREVKNKLSEITANPPHFFKYTPRALHCTAVTKTNRYSRQLQAASMSIWVVIIAQEFKLVENLRLIWNDDENRREIYG